MSMIKQSSHDSTSPVFKADNTKSGHVKDVRVMMLGCGLHALTSAFHIYHLGKSRVKIV
jgi:hypothetical protein